MHRLPDPNTLFPNAYGTTCFLKNAITAPNIQVGDYTYYDDAEDPTAFERKNVLFNWPEFGDRLIIGKFCAIASGVRFMMGKMCIRDSAMAEGVKKTFRKRYRDNLIRAMELKLDITDAEKDGRAIVEALCARGLHPCLLYTSRCV